MKPPILPPDLESYEARAERVLEEQREGRVVSSTLFAVENKQHFINQGGKS